MTRRRRRLRDDVWINKRPFLPAERGHVSGDVLNRFELCDSKSIECRGRGKAVLEGDARTALRTRAAVPTRSASASRRFAAIAPTADLAPCARLAARMLCPAGSLPVARGCVSAEGCEKA